MHAYTYTHLRSIPYLSIAIVASWYVCKGIDRGVGMDIHRDAYRSLSDPACCTGARARGLRAAPAGQPQLNPECPAEYPESTLGATASPSSCSVPSQCLWSTGRKYRVTLGRVRVEYPVEYPREHSASIPHVPLEYPSGGVSL